MLIGLGKMVKKIIQAGSLLRTLLYTYTVSGTPGTSGGAYYGTTTTKEVVNGFFVASDSSNAKAFGSEDGINWAELANWKDQQITAYNNLHKINNTLVAISGINSYMTPRYSLDGVNWLDGKNSVSGEAIVFDTAAGKIVQAGNLIYVFTSNNMYATSDGINWDYVSLPSMNVADLSSVVTSVRNTNNGWYFISVSSGSEAGIYWSYNGLNWGSNQKISHSSIGASGTDYLYVDFIFSQNVPHFLFNSDHSIAIVEIVNTYYLGTPTITLTGLDSVAVPDRRHLRIMDKFVLLDSSGNSYTSLDAVTWTLSSQLYDSLRLSTYNAFNGLFYWDGKYTALSPKYGNLFISTDGLAWTEIWNASQITGKYDYYQVSIANGLLAFTSSSDISESSLVTSPGVSSGFVVTNFANQIWDSVVYRNNKYFLSHVQDGQVSVSDDGQNWTTTTLPDWGYRTVVNTDIEVTREVQSNIGNQGTPGSYVEQLLPVTLYETTSSTTFDRIVVTNSSSNDVYFDILSNWGSFPDWDPVIVSAADNDVLVPANSTITHTYQVTLGPTAQFNNVIVSATAANALTFNIYSA